MKPDFSKKTVDTVAKRAGYRCSNPDCGVATVGPNLSVDKATVIGEAAHISGARLGSPRYDESKTDTARSTITNSIWLCRNCHKMIDSDADRYSAELLYIWRERHEQKILGELGSETDRIQAEIDSEEVSQFSEYPAIIRRIVLDKPEGWEFLLTAELFRYLTKDDFRKLQDLQNGMYNTVGDYIHDDQLLNWLTVRIREMSTMVEPATKLLERLTNSWGQPGEAGDIDEIHHTCLLLERWIHQIVEYEERLYATIVSDDYQECKDVVSGILGSQALKLATIPETLHSTLEQALEHSESDSDETLVITHQIVFELPDGWSRRAEHIVNSLEKGIPPDTQNDSTSLFGIIGWGAFGVFLLYLIF